MPFHNPFGSLAHLGSQKSDGAPDPPEPAPTPAPSPQPSGTTPVARAVVRIERSGRGGKEVTVVEHLGLGAAECAAWLKSLKGALGCGGVVENGALVLQGDQRARLPDLLRARGVKKITVAS
jgi:translation initiation factor 1